MDTTLIYNQVKIPYGINTYVENLPDTVSVQVQDPLRVVLPCEPVESLLGLSSEWWAIIIPTMASIIVFVFGHLIERCHERSLRKSETENFRNTLFAWIDLVEKPVRKQISSIRVFSDAIKNNITLQNERLMFSHNMVNKINIATADNIVNYLINNSSKPDNDKRGEFAFNIVSQMDFLQAFESEIRSQYDAYERQSMALFEDWNPNIKRIQRLCNSVNTCQVAFDVQTLRGIVETWRKTIAHNNSEVDIPLTFKNLIEPILITYRDHEYGHSGYEELDQIIESTKILNEVYYRWKVLSEGFSKVFEGYANNAESALRILLEAKKYFASKTKAIK